MSSCCADQIIALSASEQDLFKNLDESCRRAVRKGMDAGLKFEAVTMDAAQYVDSYFNIAEESAKRTKEEIAPRSYFDDLVSYFARISRIGLCFALHNGQRVAAVLLAIDKGAASYLGGVSLPDYLPKRVNDFLHWSAIKWANSNGLQWYRLGPVFPEAPSEWPISMVSRFKAKFGGRSWTIIQGGHYLHPDKYAAIAAEHTALMCNKTVCCKPLL